MMNRNKFLISLSGVGLSTKISFVSDEDSVLDLQAFKTD